MAPTRLFITGATGYIGGSVLDKLVQVFPDIQIRALLRKTSAEFSNRYPRIEIVTGDFDSFEVIEKAASEADIIIHTGDIDHEGCAKAIISGCKKNQAPSYLIHLSGTGCIADHAEQTWEGKINDRIWNDIKDIQDIYNLPLEAMHHAIDRDIMDASNGKLKTAIICPPDIYGSSSGTGSRTTFLVPEYVKAVMDKGEAFYLGAGENTRGVTHIDDLVDFFMILIGEALKGGGKADWGKEDFYFATTGEIAWKDAATVINKLGVDQGWLSSESKPVSWTAEQVGHLVTSFPQFPGIALYLWGANSQAEAVRAKKLGWKPSGPTFWEQLPEDVANAVKMVKQ